MKSATTCALSFLIQNTIEDGQLRDRPDDLCGHVVKGTWGNIM